MSHLGHRLSALIDEELDGSERDRVLVHLAGCESCRAEAVALRTLKRRMNSLGEASADSALTRRLIGLAELGEARPGLGGHRAAPARCAREIRPPWYLAVGATAVAVAGVGTAAFLAGGSGTAQPAPSITPAVDTYMVQHEITTGVIPVSRVSRVPRAPHRYSP